VAVRAPHIEHVLRCFCLGAFGELTRELDDGADLPFAFEEHDSPGRPALYEYRPLVRGFVEERAARLSRREDARLALAELRREPAAEIFARAHAGNGSDADAALLHSVLLPMLIATAEACGGFDWQDDAFDRQYASLERSLFGGRHAYVALAPLVGLSAGQELDLGAGLRVRPAAPGELSKLWPEAKGLLPADFGREPDRLLVLELGRDLPADSAEAPDAPGELADAVTAIRLATAAAVAAGPVVFERLDWRPYGIRPAVPIAATLPAGEAARLDPFRGRLAADLRERLVLADDDPELGEALDRWELSLFQAEPFRSEQLRESLGALLGGADGLWSGAARAALLLGAGTRERAELMMVLRALARGDAADALATDAVRRSLVEVLLHGDRSRLVAWLDDALLGVRPRPTGYFARVAGLGPQGSAAVA
jgi:hypothetical protein